MCICKSGSVGCKWVTYRKVQIDVGWSLRHALSTRSSKNVTIGMRMCTSYFILILCVVP